MIEECDADRLAIRLKGIIHNNWRDIGKNEWVGIFRLCERKGIFNEVFLKTNYSRRHKILESIFEKQFSGDLFDVVYFNDLLERNHIFRDHPELKECFCCYLQDKTDARDMVTEFASTLLKPALLAMCRLPDETTGDLSTFVKSHGRDISYFLQNNSESIARSYFTECSLANLAGWSASWHIPANGIPREFFTLAHKNKWHSLLKDRSHIDVPSTLSDDQEIKLECLRTTESLQEESERLGHCVGRYGYEKKCNTGDCHIFSIRMGNNSHSTFELKLIRPNEKSQQGYWHYAPITIPGTNYRLGIIQHKAHKNEKPDDRDDRILRWFMNEIEQGKINLNTDNLGAIFDPADKLPKTHGLPEVFFDIGYLPEWKNIERIFNEYNSRDMRRAAIGKQEDGQIIFAPDTPEYRYIAGQQEFTDSKGNSHILPCKNMDLRTWLRVSGLEEKIRVFICDKFPERAEKLQAQVWHKAPTTDELCEACWKKEQRKIEPSALHAENNRAARNQNPSSQNYFVPTSVVKGTNHEVASPAAPQPERAA